MKEQADGRSRRAGGFHQFLKKAKTNPEAQPSYGRYAGYET